MDLEALDVFIDSFWSEIISPLDPDRQVSASFSCIYKDFIWMSRPIIINNDHQSLHYLKSSILSGSLASRLRMNEAEGGIKCYIQYVVI